MNHHLIDSIPYVSGGAAFATTALASVVPDSTTMWIQAGVAGLFAIFMLKVIPVLLNHMRETSERHIATMKEESDRHEKTIQHLVESNERKDEAWQSIIQSRGVCPLTGKIENNQTTK